MKKTLQITVSGVDNGFIVASQGDERDDRSRKIASSREEARIIVQEIVDKALANTSTQPQQPQ